MPSKRLDTVEHVSVTQHAIVGQYWDAAISTFVQHVALVAEPDSICFGDTVSVYHVAPPIIAGERTRQAAQESMSYCSAHVTGNLSLSVDAQKRLKTWLSQVDHECQRTKPIYQYILVPHFEWVEDKKTKIRRFRRFSCVGFVLEAIRAATSSMVVVTTDEELPDVKIDFLYVFYGDDRLGNPKFRDFLGIGGDGPWRVLLPGYLFHALSIPLQELLERPYMPSDGDAFFPHNPNKS